MHLDALQILRVRNTRDGDTADTEEYFQKKSRLMIASVYGWPSPGNSLTVNSYQLLEAADVTVLSVSAALKP
jgi:hypothetical protein